MEEPVRVTHGSHVTLHYRIAVLTDSGEREVVSTFESRPATLTVGGGELAAPLEARLLGLAEGDQASFDLAAGEGFGERSPDLVRRISRSELGARTIEGGCEPGDLVQLESPEGQRVSGLICSSAGDELTIDFNHPLAGVPLRLSVRVVGVLS
jgi:FKBP-type peptidyl-prolyl cis-trans isomerase SlpA